MYWRIAGICSAADHDREPADDREDVRHGAEQAGFAAERRAGAVAPAALKGKPHSDAADEQQMRNRENHAERDGQPVAIGASAGWTSIETGYGMAPIIRHLVAMIRRSCARMRAMRIALSLAALGSLLALGQPAPASIERGTLRLHYVQKPIGYERYEIVARRRDGERRAAS